VRLARAAGIGLAGLGLILVALTFESAILFVPGAALVLIGVIAPLWVAMAARTAAVSRTVHADQVLEQQPLEATIEVGHGRLGLPGAEVVEPLAGESLPLRVAPFHLHPALIELRVVVRFERRGRRTLRAPRIALKDPLGLVRLERVGAGAGQEVLVLPRIELPRLSAGYYATRPRFEGHGPAAETLSAIEVDGLQEYRHGTPASRIHWLALARGEGLLERRLRAEGSASPLVVLDTRCQEAGERLDRAVRATASLTHYLARRSGCELLLPGDRRAIKIERDLGAWRGAHARLALVEGGPRAPAPAISKRHLTVFYVVSELPAGGHMPQAAEQYGAVLIVPAELAGHVRRPSVLDVAGCVGIALGELRSRDRAGERRAVA
jgi:uncharacterized protein (DUF58 family)